jgi:hypothetical protein
MYAKNLRLYKPYFCCHTAYIAIDIQGQLDQVDQVDHYYQVTNLQGRENAYQKN